ncbi:hypothetical protein SASPL_150850 [Salvia splendens]|uniref:Uncharacterized protein n=1 Tax=Salvia splendens TaxID=180675 RepID=A0A8X8Z243_SALSN|nr:hypothetical protein SASPL_150850 [Salvia splendens]
MQNAPQLGDDTLMSLFIAGLQDSFKHELLTKRPVSLNEAFALAQQLAAYHKLSAPPTVQHKPQWGDRDSRQRQPPALTTAPPPRPAQMPQGRPTGTQPDQPRRNGIPEPECELFEMVSVPPDSEPPSTADTTPPLDATPSYNSSGHLVFIIAGVILPLTVIIGITAPLLLSFAYLGMG